MGAPLGAVGGTLNEERPFVVARIRYHYPSSTCGSATSTGRTVKHLHVD